MSRRELHPDPVDFGGRDPTGGRGSVGENPAPPGSVESAAALLEAPRSERVASVYDFDPFDYQADVLDAPAETGAKRILWVCGRQVGKTETAGVIPADWVLSHPGEDAMIAAQYQGTSNELFRRTKSHFENVGTDGQVGVDTPNKKTYELDTGSRIMSRTIGAGSGEESGNAQRGKVPSCIVVEEASIPNKSVFDRVLRPMFATHDDYLMILISTPRGKNGYLWEKWNDAAESDRWVRFHNKTADNPLVSADWLAGERADVDELTWRQEYLGEFVETGHEYIPTSLYESAEGGWSLDSAEPADGPLYLAEDPARSGDDRSVYLGLDSTGTVFMARSHPTESVPEAVRRLRALNNSYGFARIYIDDSSGGVVDYATEALSNIRGVRFTLQSKAEMYSSLKGALENGEVSLPDSNQGDDSRRLKDETTALTFGYSKNEILQVSHPPGGHDDYPDTLALVWKAKEDHESAGERETVRTRENAPGLHSRSNLKHARKTRGADNYDDDPRNRPTKTTR